MTEATETEMPIDHLLKWRKWKLTGLGEDLQAGMRFEVFCPAIFLALTKWFKSSEAHRHFAASDELQHPGSSLRHPAPVSLQHRSPGLELQVAAAPEGNQASPTGHHLSPGGSVQSFKQPADDRHKARSGQGNFYIIHSLNCNVTWPQLSNILSDIERKRMIWDFPRLVITWSPSVALATKRTAVPFSTTGETGETVSPPLQQFFIR